MSLVGGGRFRYKKLIRRKRGAAGKIKCGNGRLITQATLKGVVTPPVFLDVTPFLNHSTPADERTQKQDGGDGSARAVHLLVKPSSPPIGGCNYEE